MSRRKRKHKSRWREQTKSIATPESSMARRPKGKQRVTGLVLLAIVLLGVAAWMTYRRGRGMQPPPRIEVPSQEIISRPLAARSGPDAPPRRFRALAPERTGIHFVHAVEEDHPLSYLYFSSMASGGIAVGDVSGDGRPDIYVVGGPGKNKLYVQSDDSFRFDDVTDRAGVDGGNAWGCGPTMVDVNGDGRLDIFVANYDSPNQLFINYGNGKFVDEAVKYGLHITDASLEGVFADYDRDGDLDLYLLTYRYENPAGMPADPPVVYRGGTPTIHPDFEQYYEITDDAIGYGVVGRSDGLLRNNGDGTFSNVSFESGIQGIGHGQSATWWDYNNDGFPDLFVGNDFNDADRLYRNNGDGTFTDVAPEVMPHTSWFSMGSDAGDIDGDGKIDLLTADMSSTTHFKQKTTMGAMSRNRKFLETAQPRQYMRNALLINTGTDRFEEAAYLTGLESTDWTWAVKIADLDCDGRQDVFVTNGSIRSFTDFDRPMKLSERIGRTEWDIFRNTQPLKENNLAFRNEGEFSFSDVSEPWGLNYLGVSMAAAHGDFDSDGDLDLVVANLGEPLTIYRNDSQDFNRLSIRLHGRGSNRFGIGAKVSVVSNLGEQVQELHPNRGFVASNEPMLHFGCRNDREVNVTVAWPSGHLQFFPGLACNRHYEITEPAERLPRPRIQKAAPASMFQTRAGNQDLSHIENEFDDYQVQPLLPHRMSRLGPSMAAADFDGDGDDDLFLGGAAGQAGRIAIQNNQGRFELMSQKALEADRAAEDMGAVWLDFEGDGDLDLFVASGGNERDLDNDVYSLRLYLNDGGGMLSPARSGSLPDVKISAGPVAAADFDRDGDIDLFVGGRQIPGQYPLPGRSVLLRNERGMFVDVTNELASGLSSVGMVTGALWTDVDNDLDLDLMVTTEWGSIHQFKNENNQLRETSAEAGLTAFRGWWTGISGGDFDGDGDIDYVVTNMGLNTKYHASDKHPFRLYYGDFEGNGQARLVEAEYEDETLFPVRGKSCSTHAMPSLATKFTTYKAFAAASLEDIYTTKCLDEAYQCSANTLASALLLNDGEGRFQLQRLPPEAQLSPGFGVTVADFNADGVLDIFIAQNFFSPQPETGNMDGGLGCLLLGRGDGTFGIGESTATGIVLPDDATSACATDLNRDGRPDLVVATNNGPLRTLVSNPRSDEYRRGDFLAVRFEGVPTTAEIAGTRVSVRRHDSVQMVEVSAGSGYLSQQPAVLFFGAPRENDSDETWSIFVRWADGGQAAYEVEGSKNYFLIPRRGF